jgi:hypothetical protein
VASITGLQGIGYLHSEFLDYERARREQAATEVGSGLSPSAGMNDQANSR